LIKKLAKIREEQGLIDEAADLMQEVAVSVNIKCCEGFLLCTFDFDTVLANATSCPVTNVIGFLNR